MVASSSSSNAQQLLDLFARLDKVSSVELGGTRQGKPLELTLTLKLKLR